MNINTLNKLSYGMYVIATKYNDRNVGCFVNTVTQITAQNPIISVSVNKQNYTNEALKIGSKFSVSILSEETNPQVIGGFGFVSSRDTDKFAEIKYHVINELPVIDENTCGYLICEVLSIIDAETHNIFLARVLDAEELNKNAVPMTYEYYHKVIKGKAPKTAPTYIEEEVTSNMNSEFAKYKCKICGHIYDEEKEGVKFEDLPDDWVCPLCKVPKTMFEKI